MYNYKSCLTIPLYDILVGKTGFPVSLSGQLSQEVDALPLIDPPEFENNEVNNEAE